jgi:predicted nucleic acid-binding Zn ribbon protein
MSYPPCASANSEEYGASPLSDLVKKVVKGLEGKGLLTEEEMREAWREAVGADAARHSTPVSFKKESVFVNVDRSSWLYELTTKKKEILQKLEARLPSKKFKDIRFRIGDITKK